MRRTLILFSVLMLTISITKAAHASLFNGGFETGDLTGWFDNSGLASVVSSYDSDGSGTSNYFPVEGDYFATLKAGLGTGEYSTLSQVFSISEGALLQGWAAFDARDYLPFNDDAYVNIYDSAGTLLDIPWYYDVATIGDFSESPWELWSWTAPASGNYTLEFAIANRFDNLGDSYALFDANIVSNNAVIPEPASLSLLGLGILGLMGLRKRKIV